MDSFIIGAYWGSRAEELSRITKKILTLLELLRQKDEQFLNFYELGSSRKEALDNKISLDEATIQKLCLQKVRKGELDEKGFSKNGFLFGLWTGQSDEESSGLTFSVGGDFSVAGLSNRIIIKIPFMGQARDRLLKLENAKAIIEILVKVWNPDYAVLISDSLRDKINMGNNVGWITYRRSLRNIPNGIMHESVHDGHLLIVPSYSGYDIAASEKELLTVAKSIG